MKTRQEFLEHFFTRLRQAGFRVEPLPDGDLAAEVYAGNPLLCVVTRDGEIIYETYDRDNARAMTQAAEETRRAQDCHSEPPFPNMERMETVNLTGGAYYKVFESATVVLLCRRTEHLSEARSDTGMGREDSPWQSQSCYKQLHCSEPRLPYLQTASSSGSLQRVSHCVPHGY